MREREQALRSTTAERTRWGKEVLTKKLYGGAGRRPALRSNNSSGPAALTELKVKIQAEPESDFFAPTLSKVIRSRVLLLAPHYLPSVVHSRVLPSPHITHRSPRSPSQPLSVVVLLRVAPPTSLLPADAHHTCRHHPS